MDIKPILDKLGIKPDPIKDQFYLISDDIIKEMVNFANLNKNDVVLEVGAGTGTLTEEIAKKAKKVIAFEIDKKFKPVLNRLPKNVELHYEDAWEYIQLHGKSSKKKEYNKVISNMPFSFVEKFLHNLTFLNYDKVILLVPLKFVDKIKENGIFSSFFTYDLLKIVDKKNFYPIPRTNSAIIELKKLPVLSKVNDLGLFLRQYVYQHEDQKIKNSLREGIIQFGKTVKHKDITKNQAREMIEKSGLLKEDLEKEPNENFIYFEIGSFFSDKDI
jgi:16S rRNA (adenine1518-N6/adenine1519-N6)-dimethyltransferase